MAVAEEANFTRAARRVHVSQWGERQIRQLERDLGAPLFDRSGRVATLTAAGAAALMHARAVLASADRAGGGGRRERPGTGPDGGRDGDGVHGHPAVRRPGLVPPGPPGIEVELVEDNSDRLVDRVRAGAADLALVGTAGPAPDGLETLTLVSERLVAAVPPDTRWPSGSASPCPRSAPILWCMPEGTGVRAVLTRPAPPALHPDVAMQASAPAAVADLASRGLGVGILGETISGRLPRPADRGGHQGRCDPGAARPGLGADREPRPA